MAFAMTALKTVSIVGGATLMVGCSGTVSSMKTVKRGPLTVQQDRTYTAKDGKTYVVAMVGVTNKKSDFVTTSVTQRVSLSEEKGKAAKGRYEAVALELLAPFCSNRGKTAVMGNLRPEQQARMHIRRSRVIWTFSRRCA